MMRYILSSLEKLQSRAKIRYSGLTPEKLANFGKKGEKIDLFILNLSKYNKKHQKVKDF